MLYGGLVRRGSRHLQDTRSRRGFCDGQERCGIPRQLNRQLFQIQQIHAMLEASGQRRCATNQSLSHSQGSAPSNYQGSSPSLLIVSNDFSHSETPCCVFSHSATSRLTPSHPYFTVPEDLPKPLRALCSALPSKPVSFIQLLTCRRYHAEREQEGACAQI